MIDAVSKNSVDIPPVFRSLGTPNETEITVVMQIWNNTYIAKGQAFSGIILFFQIDLQTPHYI